MSDSRTPTGPSTPTADRHGPPPDLSGLSGLAIRRPVLTTMVMLALVVLGLFSFRGLPVDQFPAVDFPVVTVQTTYPGASAETIEREVSRRLEEAFNPVEGVRRISSTSLEAVSQVVVEFQLGRPVDLAAQDVRTKIETVRRDLPAGIDPPVVQKLDPASQPILSLALSSAATPLDVLTVLADETIRRRLESVPGVGEVRVAGGLAPEVHVDVDPARLEAARVTIPEVVQALGAQNLEVPAGRVEQASAEQLVRVAGRLASPEQFGDVLVAERGGDGGSAAVRVRDVADVRLGTEDERSVAFVDVRREASRAAAGAQGPQRAVALDVRKVSGANTVAVADGVQRAIAELRASLPAGTELRVVRDNSTFIRSSIHDVVVELVLGAVLTVVVVMLFLNDGRATVITALALPVSVISSFVIMGALGFTLNVMSLLGLSLSIGILVDDAIVVIENIVRRRSLGDDAVAAAATGTREIVFAVLATTLSIVAVFAPVAFMQGLIGRFFYEFGITVAWAVLVSLLVSFTLTPMLAARWGVRALHAPSGGAGAGDATVGATEARRPGIGSALDAALARFNAAFDRLAARYERLVAWALAHRRATMGLAGLSLAGAVALAPFVGGGFAPDIDSSEFVVQFRAPEGANLALTQARARALAGTLGALPEVAYTYTTIGAGVTGSVREGETYVRLVPAAERGRAQQDVMVDARRRLAGTWGLETAILAPGGPAGTAAPIAVQLRGPDVATLQRLADRALTEMRAIPGVVDVRSSLGAPRPELRVDVDRALATRLGIDLQDLAGTLRPLFAGQVATRWEDAGGEERDVVVRLPAERRRTPADVARLPMPTGATAERGAAVTVPLGAVARVTRAAAPAQIDRLGLQRVVTLSAATAPELSLSDASARIRERLTALDLPAGYALALGGDTEQLEETAGYMVEAILLAVILIFLILASQFESYAQPFAIMLSLPLSLVGVLLALLLTRTTLNIMSMIGVIMLFGLVTKNAILLVDNANERRRAGTARRESLIQAGAVRLRPIVMTTAAMIAGMLPVALALGEGGGFRAPMARAVIGGLVTSTLLTLLVVPVACSYFDDAGGWLQRLPGRVRRRLGRGAARSAPRSEPAFGD